MSVHKLFESLDGFTEILMQNGFRKEQDLVDPDIPITGGWVGKGDDNIRVGVCEVTEPRELGIVRELLHVNYNVDYAFVFLQNTIITFRKQANPTTIIIQANHKTTRKLKKCITQKPFNITCITNQQHITKTFYQQTEKILKQIVKGVTGTHTIPQKHLFAYEFLLQIFHTLFLIDTGFITPTNKQQPNLKTIIFTELLATPNFYTAFQEFYHQTIREKQPNNQVLTIDLHVEPIVSSYYIPPVTQNKSIHLTKKEWEEIITNLLDFTWIIDISAVKSVRILSKKGDKIITPEVLNFVFERVISILSLMQKNKAKEEDKWLSERQVLRKKRGVFYTPEHLTNYICKHTIEQFIYSSLEDKENYQTFDEVLKQGSRKTLREVLKVLHELKVLDPACGAGSFLLGIAQELYTLEKRVRARMGTPMSAYMLRKSVVSRIYGSDILQGAVESTRLLLWFWVIEGLYLENGKGIPYDGYEDVLHDQLEFQIITGNSLFGLMHDDVLNQSNALVEIKDEALRQVKREMNQAFEGEQDLLQEAMWLLEKGDLQSVVWGYSLLKEALLTARVMNRERLRATVLMVRKVLYSIASALFLREVKRKVRDKKALQAWGAETRFLHWGIEFHDIMISGGFSVILGNPPFGRVLNSLEKRIVKKAIPFKVSQTDSRGKGTSNLAALFIERSHNLLRPNGVLGFILPKALVYVTEWEKVRLFFLESVMLKRVVDNGKAFKDALLEMVTVISEKRAPREEKILVHEFTQSSRFTKPYAIPREYFSKDHFILEMDPVKEGIYRKITSRSVLLGEISRYYKGVPLNKYLTVEPVHDDDIPILRGKDIQRYHVKGNAFLSQDHARKVPIYRPQLVFQEIIAHINRPCPHIKITGSPIQIPIRTVNTVVNMDITDTRFHEYYVLALLHSKVLNWFIYKYIFINSIRTMHFSGRYLYLIPILVASPDSQEKIVRLIKEILRLREDKSNKNKNMEMTRLEEKLEGLIFELYEISDEEKKVICGCNWESSQKTR